MPSGAVSERLLVVVVGFVVRLVLVVDSSYQSEVLVASSLVVRVLVAVVVDVGSVGRCTVAVDDAPTVVFCFRRFIRWPPSSSEEVKPESESEAAGSGVASLLRLLALALAPRFLKETRGGSAIEVSAMFTTVNCWCLENR